jgi:transposase-like protein
VDDAKLEVNVGTRRRFSREYKQEAVALVTQRGVSVAQAARDLSLAHETLPLIDFRKLILS